MTELSRPRASAPARPITLAILAMGGEGGGVLADWIIALAATNNYRSQLTSVPGVAQRTGATIYYLELFENPAPGALAQEAGMTREPVLALMPAPGEVDIVIASELMEAGRAIQRGLVTRDRTTLIASSHRVYSMTEKIAMGDGRIDRAQLELAIEQAAKVLVSADFAQIARENASVISAPLFGALAGSGALPFEREAFEQALSSGGIGVQASRAAFARAFEVAHTALGFAPRAAVDGASRAASQAIPPERARAEQVPRDDDPLATLGPKLRQFAPTLRSEFHSAAHPVLVHALIRLADYQDIEYAGVFLEKLRPIAAFDRSSDSAQLLVETARHLALWMTYEDTIRVADLKLRSARFARVAAEQGVDASQVFTIREFLHPRVEEIADTLPKQWGQALLASRWMRNWLSAHTSKGRVITTNSIRGFMLLYMVAGLRRWRRASLRYSNELTHWSAWLAAIQTHMAANYGLALAIARLQRLVKGYGDTHQRGLGNFQMIFQLLPALAAMPGADLSVSTLAQAALADESGAQLKQAIGQLRVNDL